MHENRKTEEDNIKVKEGEQDDDFTWAALCHFSALLGIIWWVPVGVDFWLPFGHWLGPLVVWLIKRGRSPLINDAGKESLNFQLMMTLYGFILNMIAPLPTEFSLMPLLVIVDAVSVTIAGFRASKGEAYRYPLAVLRLIR